MFEILEVDVRSAEVKHVDHLVSENVAADSTHIGVVLTDDNLSTVQHDSIYIYTVSQKKFPPLNSL